MGRKGRICQTYRKQGATARFMRQPFMRQLFMTKDIIIIQGATARQRFIRQRSLRQLFILPEARGKIGSVLAQRTPSYTQTHTPPLFTGGGGLIRATEVHTHAGKRKGENRWACPTRMNLVTCVCACICVWIPMGPGDVCVCVCISPMHLVTCICACVCIPYAPGDVCTCVCE